MPPDPQDADDEIQVRKVAGGYRLVSQGKPSGPLFRTEAEALEFAKYMHDRTALAWDFQTRDVLEVRAEEFRRQR